MKEKLSLPVYDLSSGRLSSGGVRPFLFQALRVYDFSGVVFILKKVATQHPMLASLPTHPSLAMLYRSLGGSLAPQDTQATLVP